VTIELREPERNLLGSTLTVPGWSGRASPRPRKEEAAITTPTKEQASLGMPWEEQYGYAQAVKVGDTIYLSGQVSHDDEGNFEGVGDMEVQMRSATATSPRCWRSTTRRSRTSWRRHSTSEICRPPSTRA
jgi:hypothetical protein